MGRRKKPKKPEKELTIILSGEAAEMFKKFQAITGCADTPEHMAIVAMNLLLCVLMEQTFGAVIAIHRILEVETVQLPLCVRDHEAALVYFAKWKDWRNNLIQELDILDQQG